MGRDFHPTILREYDIRGIVGTTLFPEDAYAVGRAFAARSGGGEICVGRDGRLSSPALADALVEGLTAGGATARRIGCGPTPLLYYAARMRRAAGGIMVTGSHNPPDHNGFKMVLGDRPFFGADIADLGRLAAADDTTAQTGSVIEDRDIAEEYLARLAADYDGTRPLSVVWDAGNGAAGPLLTRLVERLPGRHIVLFGEIDGTFPNHHPDPTDPATLESLRARVLVEKADLGIAFDGDGDRIGVVDDRGRILWGDQLLAILAEDLLQARPGAAIVADVKASRVVFDEVARLGGRPLMGRTGHSPIKALMAETGALLAGEMSGHIFYADRWYGYDDALYAAVRLLGVVGRWTHGSLAERRDRLPQMVNTPEIRFPCADTRKFAVIDEVRNRLAAEGATVNSLDGVRVDTEDGWWLLRASNTQGVLVARCEATSDAGLERLRAIVGHHLTASGVPPP